MCDKMHTVVAYLECYGGVNELLTHYMLFYPPPPSFYGGGGGVTYAIKIN